VRQVDTFQSAFVLTASTLIERLVRPTLTPNDEILGVGIALVVQVASWLGEGARSSNEALRGVDHREAEVRNKVAASPLFSGRCELAERPGRRAALLGIMQGINLLVTIVSSQSDTLIY